MTVTTAAFNYLSVSYPIKCDLELGATSKWTQANNPTLQVLDLGLLSRALRIDIVITTII
jgi:hypothetical protein